MNLKLTKGLDLLSTFLESVNNKKLKGVYEKTLKQEAIHSF